LHRTIAALTLSSAVIFSGTTQAASSLTTPRLAGQRPDITSDEAGLWAVMDKAEQAAKTSADRVTDPRLVDYLRGQACKLAPEYCQEIRVYALQRPFFNATAAPNGYIEVWTGLMLRAQTQSELAFVLGHEISHYSQNHSIEAWRATKTRSNIALALSIAVSAAASAAAANTGSTQAANDTLDAASSINNIIYLSTVAAYFSFSRDNESEADSLGFNRATKIGLDPTAGAAIWKRLTDESLASDFPKIRKEPNRAGIFNSHPINDVRMAALASMAKALKSAVAIDRKAELAAYRDLIRPYLADWLRDDLRRKDYGQTLFLIDQLSEQGQDLGLLNFYRGEAYRLRRKAKDLEEAKQAYEKAVQSADAPPEAWRNLGDLAMAAKDHAAASAAYQAYLVHAPQAQDRWIIEDNLLQLKSGPST
jgi:predicted Zn-dependent protease